MCLYFFFSPLHIKKSELATGATLIRKLIKATSAVKYFKPHISCCLCDDSDDESSTQMFCFPQKEKGGVMTAVNFFIEQNAILALSKWTHSMNNRW